MLDTMTISLLELKLSFKELSKASQKAAIAISSLEVKKAICILPKV